MSTPKPTESPPIALAPRPVDPPPKPAEPQATKPSGPAKSVTLTKPEGGKWTLKLEGPVKRSDINHLRRLIQIEFLRAKRRERVAQNTQNRKDQTNATVSR